MAKTKNSLTLGLIVLLGLSLCLVGASALVAPHLAWSTNDQPDFYQLRDGLDTLKQTARVKAEVVQPTRNLDVRRSDPLEIPNGPYPVRLIIPSIGVDALVEAVGLEEDTSTSGARAEGDDAIAGSTVAVPGRTEAGWYRYGSAPGQPGATVLAGHVDLGGQEGVFWDLTDLESGAKIEIHLSDGSVAEYRTMRGTDFSRDSLPSEELFRHDGAPALHLITCGGTFNRNLGRYESNYVVTAAPIYSDA